MPQFEEVWRTLEAGGTLIWIILAVSLVGWFTAMRGHLLLRRRVERRAMTRPFVLVEVLAAAAPLLGLLGTVRGMGKAFAALELFGAAEPGYLSAGVSEALITTEAGLVVALPLLVLASWGRHRSERLFRRRRMEERR